MTEESKPVPQESAPEAAAPPTMSIEWLPAEDGGREIYSNVFFANWTHFDVRLRFGQQAPDPRNPALTAPWAIIERAVVTVPWGQMKYLRDMLSQCIEQYEKANGEITVPKLP